MFESLFVPIEAYKGEYLLHFETGCFNYEDGIHAHQQFFYYYNINLFSRHYLLL